ncbi:MAG: patatin family protein [Oscillospiraceae bacterium]|nr:patatin family protein [Oscillospiraceae bacterium]
MKTYSGIDRLPTGRAAERITRGCLVLEGGGWKGLYTLGVLDRMMEKGINLSSVVGVSAGALSALGYVSGQIGWGAGIDLTFRHDRNYCGIGAFRRDHGVTGFSYLFQDILKQRPIDEARLNDPARRLAVSATDLETGEVKYFEKGSCDLYKAVQASASVPYVTRPVVIDGVPYLDGGCAEKIPFRWSETAGEKKIVVVRTRELSYRRKPGAPRLAGWIYRKYPAFVRALGAANEEFNRTVDMLERKAAAGEIFLIAPSEPVKVSRFDGDMEKLGALYWLGYRDMERRQEELVRYLEN